MTLQEAHDILNLREGATPQQINQAYQELYNDYHIRLTNAPTSSLKQMYQRNMGELEEAKGVLLQQQNHNTNPEDLVSATPILISQAAKQEKPKRACIENSTSSPQPQTIKEPKKRNLLIPVLLVIITVSLSIGVYLYWQNLQLRQEQKKENLTENTEQPEKDFQEQAQPMADASEQVQLDKEDYNAEEARRAQAKREIEEARKAELLRRGSFTDSRDGKTYKTVKIGTQVWMAENLAYLPKVSPPRDQEWGAGYDPIFNVYGYYGNNVEEAKKTKNYITYGVLYSSHSARQSIHESTLVPSGLKGVCPKGWHLPSDGEWKILEKEFGIGEKTINTFGWREIKPKSYELSSMDYSCNDVNAKENFFVELSGVRLWDGRFVEIGEAAYFWCSSDIYRVVSKRTAIKRVKGGYGGYCVRCVKD